MKTLFARIPLVLALILGHAACDSASKGGSALDAAPGTADTVTDTTAPDATGPDATLDAGADVTELDATELDATKPGADAAPDAAPDTCTGAGCGDPCDGVTCDAPPSPCHAATGTCQGGECLYEFEDGAACDDSDPCTTDDACKAGACAGTVMACDTPEANVCDDESTLLVAATQGTCADGLCEYETTKIPCNQGCIDGSCLGDPCAGVTCDTPPGPCYADAGTCSGGGCVYAPLDGAACDDGDGCTSGDTCEDGSCSGTQLACDDPPANECKAFGQLHVYATPGLCQSGACVYASADVQCPGACNNGSCAQDPCAGKTCQSPPNGCFAAAGTCTNGVCSYAYEDGAACDDAKACTAGDACQSGICAGKPVTCTTPPAPLCDGDTLVTSSPAGTCVGGACDYPETSTSCGFGCESGACVGDPCGGVTCDDPSAPTCVSASVLRTYASSGTCAAGVCTYAKTDTTCPFGCEGGACDTPTGIVISEALYDATGADTDTFVELHGPAGADLSGFTLYGINGNGGGTYQSLQLTGNIGADGLYVIAHPDATAWIKSVADQLDKNVDYQNGPDSIVLAFGDEVLDALAYGSFGASDVPAGEGTPAVDPPAGQSLARDADYTDTDDNSADFKAFSTPTPGAENVVGCPEGQLVCGDSCIDPKTSSEYCGATSCTKKPCDAGQTCVGGKCESGCTDACTAGATKCQDALVQTCAVAASGCLAWGTAAACPAGETCTGDACEPTCTDACTAGATKCQGASVQTCGVAASGCLAWGTATSCPAGGTCTGAGLCGAVISADTTLCGEQVFGGPFAIQGGAKVTCPSGELTIRAASIFIDPSSSIDLSATSSSASGAKYNQCTGSCNGNGVNTGSSGGGNGTKGESPASTSFEVKYDDYCGGWWGWTCKSCAGPGGGGVRDTAWGMEVSAGGKGGDGCYSVSPGTGSCYQSSYKPGGKGGGVIRLFADTTIKVLGTVRADGAPGGSTADDRAGAGGGAGGGILLYAKDVSITGTVSAEGGAGGPGKTFATGDCGNLDSTGGAGGQGRVKILYGDSLTKSGTVVGVESVTFAPPLDVWSETHPDTTLWYNDTFSELTVAWEPAFAGALGYWTLVSSSASVQLTPGNGTYTTETTLTASAATFTKAGPWYVHLASVSADAQVGSVQSTYTFKINDLPPVVTSSSHPSESAWYAATALTFAFAAPGETTSDSFAGHWYRLDHAKGTAPGKAAAGYTFTKNAQVLLTKDWQEEAVAPGTYYLHVVAEDTVGNLTKSAATYRVQIGAEPTKTNFYGYVTGPTNAALEGVTVTLEPYGLTATTDKNGYYIFSDVYVGPYALTATLEGHATYTEQVEVAPANVPHSFSMQ